MRALITGIACHGCARELAFALGRLDRIAPDAGETLNYELYGHFDIPCGLKVSAENSARHLAERGSAYASIASDAP